MKFLIVDDHAPSRALMREFLAPLASAIEECADGADAEAAYARLRPDFVLMDLMMPGVDGLEATSRILRRHPDAVIIMVTQVDTREARARASAVGARHFFAKDSLADLRRFLTDHRPTTNS